MTKSEAVLSRLFAPKERPFAKSDHASFTALAREALGSLGQRELAEFYVALGFLRSGLDFLGEQRWIQRKQSGAYPQAGLIEKFLVAELVPLGFLREVLGEAFYLGAEHLKDKARVLEAVCLSEVGAREFKAQKQFSIQALLLISELFQFEAKLLKQRADKGEYLGLRLYRAFDGLDAVFNLNYAADDGMRPQSFSSERLYQGGGVGVQSGYSTVLLALRELNPALGARFVDLGSGFGRVGLVVGLLRPDIYFKGYEYVQERVEVAQLSATNLNLQGQVQFHTQDLAAKEFRIPDAEIYYLYDPFNAETYRHVLNQVREVSRRQKIAVATKGNARSWLGDLAREEGWLAPQEFDDGNFCLFRSR